MCLCCGNIRVCISVAVAIKKSIHVSWIIINFTFVAYVVLECISITYVNRGCVSDVGELHDGLRAY